VAQFPREGRQRPSSSLGSPATSSATLSHLSNKYRSIGASLLISAWKTQPLMVRKRRWNTCMAFISSGVKEHFRCQRTRARDGAAGSIIHRYPHSSRCCLIVFYFFHPRSRSRNLPQKSLGKTADCSTIRVSNNGCLRRRKSDFDFTSSVNAYQSLGVMTQCVRETPALPARK